MPDKTDILDPIYGLNFSADFWRAEYHKAKLDNAALHKGIRRLKRREEFLLATLEWGKDFESLKKSTLVVGDMVDDD